MKWEDVSSLSRHTMRELGEFGPTVNAEDRVVKGVTFDDGDPCKTYWSSGDLRQIAAACAEVADWLDKRAASAQGDQQ